MIKVRREIGGPPCTEGAETQVWLDFALRCGYLGQEDHDQLYRVYDAVGGGLVKMMASAETWCGPAKLREDSPSYDTYTRTPTPPH